MNEWVVNKSSRNQTAMKWTWLSGAWLSLAGLALCAITLLNLSSCAHNQSLVGITVTPQGSTITLSGPGQVIGTQFTAIGTYIHPPENKDVTSTAIWATDSPTIITLDPNQPGLVNTTGEGCGTNLGVTATIYSKPGDPSSGSVVVGSATINVAFASGTCP
jgi:hypothetical protein